MSKLRTFSRRAAPEDGGSPPPAAVPRVRPKPPPPKRGRGGVGSGGGSLKSLARRDQAWRSSTVDDLEYALDGLSRGRGELVRRSASDVVGVCAPALQLGSARAASLLSSCGALLTLARGLAATASADPFVSLCVATLLHALSQVEPEPATAVHILEAALGRLRMSCAALDASGAPPTPPGPVGVARQGSELSTTELVQLAERLRALSPLAAELLPEAGSAEAGSAEALGAAAAPLVRRQCLASVAAMVGRSSRARAALVRSGGVPSLISLLDRLSGGGGEGGGGGGGGEGRGGAAGGTAGRGSGAGGGRGSGAAGGRSSGRRAGGSCRGGRGGGAARGAAGATAAGEEGGGGAAARLAAAAAELSLCLETLQQATFDIDTSGDAAGDDDEPGGSGSGGEEETASEPGSGTPPEVDLQPLLRLVDLSFHALAALGRDPSPELPPPRAAPQAALASSPGGAKPVRSPPPPRVRQAQAKAGAAAARSSADPFEFGDDEDTEGEGRTAAADAGSATPPSRASGARPAAAKQGRAAAEAAAPSPGSAREAPAAAESDRRQMRAVLLLSLKVAVNLTNHRPHGCAQLLSHPTALPALAALLSSEFDGCERRGGLPRHFDTALMSLGLLTNVLEVLPDAKLRIGAAPAGEVHAAAAPSSSPAAASGGGGGGGTLLHLLGSVLRSLLRPMPAGPPPQSHEGEPAGGPSSRHMEREIAGAYTALLLGFLCRGVPAHCDVVLGTLGAPSFGPVSELLRSFLTLHSSAKLLSPEGTRAMASVVAWMESYRPAQPPAGTG